MATTNTADRLVNIGSANTNITIISFTTSGDHSPSLLALSATDGGAGGNVRYGFKPLGGRAESYNATNNSVLPATGIAIPLHSKSGIEFVFAYPNGGGTGSIYLTLSNVERS